MTETISNIGKVFQRPLRVAIYSPPQISDNALRLMIQCARHGGTLRLEFQYIKNQGISGTAIDSDGVEHRRGTVKSWGARRMFDVRWSDYDGNPGYGIAYVTLTQAGTDWLVYLRDMLNEAPI